MSVRSEIEWTDATWNPVRGCTKVSPGCRSCYAETFAERFRGVKGHSFEFGFDLRLIAAKLEEPLNWTKSKRIFVNSMSDLFQEGVPDEFIRNAFEVMALADWHTYQVLTKRPERMKSLFDNSLKEFGKLNHIWLGVSVEDRKHGLPRIDALRETNAAVRFLSVEPLLEDLGEMNLESIDWVIVGGESGPRARPMKEEWVQPILKRCHEQGVPFFFKQWGGVNKKRNGRTLNGRRYDEYPDVCANACPGRKERLKRIERFKGEIK